jgi:hypothetical protein
MVITSPFLCYEFQSKDLELDESLGTLQEHKNLYLKGGNLNETRACKSMIVEIMKYNLVEATMQKAFIT